MKRRTSKPWQTVVSSVDGSVLSFRNSQSNAAKQAR